MNLTAQPRLARIRLPRCPGFAPCGEQRRRRKIRPPPLDRISERLRQGVGGAGQVKADCCDYRHKRLKPAFVAPPTNEGIPPPYPASHLSAPGRNRKALGSTLRSAYGSSTDRRHSYGSKGVFTMSFDTVIAFATAGGLLATTAQLALQLIQNSRDSKAVQEKIRKIELSEESITDYKTLTLSKIQRAAKMQELMMVNARPRADVLFRIGVILLLLSLACPVVATWIYWRYEPLSGDEIARIVSLKQSLGDLPKDFNLSTELRLASLAGRIDVWLFMFSCCKGHPDFASQ